MANPDVSDAEYKSMFDEVDVDKDGLITFDEFQKFLTTNEISKDDADTKVLFDVLDQNKDGKINLEEVKKGMEKIFSELEQAIEASLNKDD